MAEEIWGDSHKRGSRLVCESGSLLSAPQHRKLFGFTATVCHQIIKLGFVESFIFNYSKISIEAWSLFSSLLCLTA